MRFKDKSFVFLAGVGLGAAVMYFMDPGMGARRRAIARDRLSSAGRQTGEAIEGHAKDLANRAKGVAARTRRRFEDAVAGDDVLVQRVRTALGRVISNPRLVNVEADNGEVTLTGTVSEEDAKALGPVVGGVRGVQNVVDRTEVEEEAIG